MYKATVVKVLVAALLSVVAVNAGVAHAQGTGEKIKPYAIGGGLGLAQLEGVGSAIQFSVFADLGNPTNLKGLAFFPSISIWSKSYNDSPYGNGWYYGEYYGDVSYHEFSVNVDGHYYFNPEANTNFYAGGGLGMSFLSASGYSHSAIGLRLLGGLETPISKKNTLVAQLTYKADSNLNNFAVQVGITFDLAN